MKDLERKFMSEKAFVAVLKTSEGYFLILNKKGDELTILGWQSLKEAIDYFEDGYDNNHRRGHEASMSACINYIQFQPRILSFDTLQELSDKLQIKGGKIGTRINSISGSYNVLKLKDELIEPLYDEAVSPKLIS